MQNFITWLSKHKFQTHIMILILIALPPIGLYFAAPDQAWTLALLAIIATGNLLAILTR